MIQVKIEWVERFQCALSLLGGLGEMGIVFSIETGDHVIMGFDKLHLLFYLHFFTNIKVRIIAISVAPV